MKYSEVEQTLTQSILSASHSGKRALALYALTQLTTLEGLDQAIANEFDSEAAEAFREAVQHPARLDAPVLTEYLNRIDAGDLSDGDMDLEPLRALNALEFWRDFQAGDTDTAARALAMALLEFVDFEIDGASLDDFLSHPRMMTEFETINRLLAGATHA